MSEKGVITTDLQARKISAMSAPALLGDENTAKNAAHPVDGAVVITPGEASAENAAREQQAVYKNLLAEAMVVFHDRRTSSRQMATQLLVRLVGRLAVVQSADDIQAVVEKIHVPHPSRSGVDAIVTDLDPKVPKLMEFLKLRSLRPGLGKLPIVPVVIVVDPDDPRPELLASAIDSGVDAIMRRPLDHSILTSCVGEVLRRNANVEFVYKDVVGEVETFNYPRFLLEGFHFLGGGESSAGGVGDGDGANGFNEVLGEAVRTYTRQASVNGNGSMTTAGSSGWAQESLPPTHGGGTTGLPVPSKPSVGTLTMTTAKPAAQAAKTEETAQRAIEAESRRRTCTGDGSTGVGASKQIATRMMGKAKMVTTIQGGHVKISSPSLRPRLYLSSGDKGYASTASAANSNTSNRGGGGTGGEGSGVRNNASSGGRDCGGEAADGVAESEKQVSRELAPFVKRRAPVLGDRATSSGLDKAQLATTMRLVENTFSFTKGQDAKTAWVSKGRKAPEASPAPPPAGAHASKAAEVAAATAAGGRRNNAHPRTSGGSGKNENVESPAANKVRFGDSGTADTGDTWKAAPPRAPRPDDGNPLSQKKIFSSTGTQGRRTATQAGIFDEALRNHQTNINPTEIATTAALRCALGVSMKGEAAARAVIGRMVRQRKVRRAAESGQGGGSGGGKGGKVERRGLRRMRSAREARGPVTRSSGGDVGTGGSVGEGMFKTVLSSMAKKRLRTGLLEIKNNPLDVLRFGFVEIEPTKYGSTALGCHLIKGWVEQKAGNKRRALAHFRRAVASEPENVEALFCKAVLSAQLMELFDALKDFSAAISFKLDEIRIITQQRGASKRRPMAATPHVGQGAVGTGTVESKNGAVAARQGGEGVEGERGSGESNVGLAHLYGNRGLVHVCLGDDISALDDLDHAVARDTRNITYRSNRALILRRVGDFRGAQQDYSRIRALQTLEQASATRKPGPERRGTTPTPFSKGGGNTAGKGRATAGDGASDVVSNAEKITTGGATGAHRAEIGVPEGVTEGVPNGDGGSGGTGTDSGQQPITGTPQKGGESNATLNHDRSTDDPSNVVQSTSEKIDARVSEDWSDQFRDRRLMEDNFRRRALARQLLLLEDGSAEGAGEGSGLDFPEEGGAERGRGMDTGFGQLSGGRAGGAFRKGSGNGASLGEFKASVGLSAKGELFDDLFCRPSCLDQALTAAPGKRTPRQVTHVVEALAACPSFDGLAKETMAEIGQAVEYRVLEKMAPAFLQGEETDAMVVILSGRVSVKLRRADLSAVTADELGEGDTFGEACMLDEYRTSAVRRQHSCGSSTSSTSSGGGNNNGHGESSKGKKDITTANADRAGGGSGGLKTPRADSPTPPCGAATETARAAECSGSLSLAASNAGNGEEQQHCPEADTASGERGMSPAAAGGVTGGGGSGSSLGAGRSMETYQTLEPTRLILILKDDFFRIPGLLRHCLRSFKRRLDAIKLCGLFGTWEQEDLMRLTRMSRVHRHNSKSVLLRQREEPSHLHIVLSGTCTVTKYPDRLAAVQRKVNEIGAALYRIKSKYTYHRDVRVKVAARSKDEARKIGFQPIVRSINHIGNNGNNNGTLDQRPATATGESGNTIPRILLAETIAPLPHVTSTEVRKAELEREIRRWKRTLALIRRKDGDVVDTSQTQNVGTLQYPQFFGEVCLLVPDGGEALGTVSTDTLVETVSISKFVLQTFHVTDSFLQGVRQKASIYPEDINLAKAIETEKWWEVRRRELVLEALIGPAAGCGGGGWKHKNQWLVRKRPKRPATAS